MVKQIFKIIILIFLLFSFTITTFAESLADKYKKNKWVVTIRLELKLEDENRKELLLPIQAVWKNKLRNKTYQIKYFSQDNHWFITMEKRIPKDELTWFIYLYDQRKEKSEKVLNKIIKIPIEYNFEGSSSTKTQLYFLQMKEWKNWFDLNKIYTKYDLEKEEKIDEIKPVYLKWNIDSHFFKKWINVWLYDSEGNLLYSDFSDSDWLYEMDLEWYKDKIKIDKDYFLIWGKDWSIELKEYWFLWEWLKYNFSSYKELRKTFSLPIKLHVNLNNKDKAVKEDFPYLFLAWFILIYISFLYFLFSKIIKKIFVKALNRKQKVVFSSRKQKILNIKNKLW